MSVTGQEITSPDDEKKMPAFFFEVVNRIFFILVEQTLQDCGLGPFGEVGVNCLYSFIAGQML